MNLEDLRLRDSIEKVFVTKETKPDMSQSIVIAAVITAASKMSLPSEGIATPEMTTEELLDLYGKTDDETVTSLIEMSPTFVKPNIGYSVDFQDISSAYLAYETNKETYDALYTKIADRNKQRELNNGKSM